MPIYINGTTGISGVDGSASTPAVQGSDTNTGMYFPAADRIGFAEGGTQVGEFDASSNFLFNSGYGSVAIAYGCRAWVNFDGTGTVAIRGSGNVSSITDNGTGDYTVNFTTAMPDTNFSGVVSASGVVNSQHLPTFLGSPGSNDTSSHPSASAFRFSTYNVTNSGLRGDPVMVNAAIFR
jgi:hypothetical protein